MGDTQTALFRSTHPDKRHRRYGRAARDNHYIVTTAQRQHTEDEHREQQRNFRRHILDKRARCGGCKEHLREPQEDKEYKDNCANRITDSRNNVSPSGSTRFTGSPAQ